MSDALKLSLAKAVVNILRPMVRMLMRFEFTHAELSELVRQTYVEIADKDFLVEGQEMTISRVAVLTGLSRKEVVRLRALLEQDTTSLKQAPNRAQRVVRGWMSDKEFLDKNKQPKVLPIKGDRGSFMALVKRYSGDITYGAVLEELNHINITKLSDDGKVVLVNMAYVPHAEDIEQVRILAMCASDLLKTTVRNIDSVPEEKYFQRQVTYNKLSEDAAKEFRVYSRRKAEKLVSDLNQFLQKKREQAGRPKKNHTARVGMGIYYLEEDQEASVSKALPKKKE